MHKINTSSTTEIDQSAELSDLFDQLNIQKEMPNAEWLIRLNIQPPRRNIRCISTRSRWAKRSTDVVGSLVLGTLLAPVWLVVPVLVVVVGGPGPIIFCQTRVGLNLRAANSRRHPDKALPPGQGDRRVACADRRVAENFGKPYTMYKFRTMRMDAEKDGAQFAQQNDQRVTTLGRFMRRTRIDEIAQLINVLRGEMSLVGPRPERPVFVEQLNEKIPNYINRLGLKPGLSGLAQIENGYDNTQESFRRKVAYDLLYLQNCCLRNDLKVLLRTVHVVVTGKGAL